MPVDTNGNASRPSSPLPVSGQTADAPQVNVPVDDIYSILNLLAFLDGRKPMRGNQDLNGYKATGAADGTNPQDYVTLSQVAAMIANISGTKTGRLEVATGNQIEPGYIAANGGTHNRADLPDLWAYALASGNLAATQGAKTAGQYGPGNGSTTFTVPNLYADGGYFIRPVSSGRAIGTLQADELKSHPHTATFAGTPVPDHAHLTTGASGGGNAFGGGNTGIQPANTSQAGGHTPAGTVTVSATGGTETRPKNIAYPVLIKT